MTPRNGVGLAREKNKRIPGRKKRKDTEGGGRMWAFAVCAVPEESPTRQNLWLAADSPNVKSPNRSR